MTLGIAGSSPGNYRLIPHSRGLARYAALSDGDLRAVKKANAHFSDDVLSSLLNEPIPGHGVFWSSSGDQPYTIPIRALLFEEAYGPLDPTYDRPALDCYAAQLKGQLTGAMDAAVEAAGGNPVTVAGTPDASETFKLAAIRKLAVDREFDNKVHSERGITWGQVQSKLATFVSEITAQSPDQAREWVFSQYLVKHALTEILGPENDGWRTESRPAAQSTGASPRRVTWIMATEQGKTRIPEAPVAWAPEDEYSTSDDDTLF